LGAQTHPSLREPQLPLQQWLSVLQNSPFCAHVAAEMGSEFSDDAWPKSALANPPTAIRSIWRRDDAPASDFVIRSKASTFKRHPVSGELGSRN
jgi:hypothetical protein